MKVKHVEAYSLFEFCQKVEDAFNAGFKFDFKTNAHVPTSYGTYYTTMMVSDAKEAEKAVEAEVQVDGEVEKAQEGVKKPRRGKNEG